MFKFIKNWFKKVQNQSYQEELRGAVVREYCQPIDKVFNKLAKEWQCERYEVRDDGAVEFFFPANSREPHRHKIVIFPNQIIYV